VTVRGRERACGRTIDGKLKTDLKQEQIINNNNNKKKKSLKNGHTVLLRTPTTLDHTLL